MFNSKQTVAWFMNCMHKNLVFQLIGKKDYVAATTSRLNMWHFIKGSWRINIP